MNKAIKNRLFMILSAVLLAWILTGTVGVTQMKRQSYAARYQRYQEVKAMFAGDPEAYARSGWVEYGENFPEWEKVKNTSCLMQRDTYIPVLPFLILSWGTSAVGDEHALHLWHFTGTRKVIVLHRWWICLWG